MSLPNLRPTNLRDRNGARAVSERARTSRQPRCYARSFAGDGVVDGGRRRGRLGGSPAAAGDEEATVAARVGDETARVQGVDGDAGPQADALQRAVGPARPALPRQDVGRQGRLEVRREAVRRNEHRRPPAQGEFRQMYR